jgi:V8-like Glu-specific endopeptidase
MNRMSLSPMLFGIPLLISAVVSANGQQASSQIVSQNGVTAYHVSPQENQASQIDFVNAKPMPMPANQMSIDSIAVQVEALLAAPSLTPTRFASGNAGTGALSPSFVGEPAAGEPGISPQEYGTNRHPFSTAKADLNSGGATATNTFYPYRAAGKLYFTKGGSSYICSASFIKRGVVVTAAHCVADFGKSTFYTGWRFIPGYRNGAAPYGTGTVRSAYVLSSYYNGTDSCYQSGVVCTNDVAVLLLNTTSSGGYIGTSTGWFGYGTGGYSYTNGQAHITQLGYPAGLDNAAYMQRNDSNGVTNATRSNNTIIGSNMDGGSSGGPWVVNFGIKPTLTGETAGSGASANIVVGVTSWGYTDIAVKEQGASGFTSTNITTLVNAACTAVAAACS